MKVSRYQWMILLSVILIFSLLWSTYQSSNIDGEEEYFIDVDDFNPIRDDNQNEDNSKSNKKKCLWEKKSTPDYQKYDINSYQDDKKHRYIPFPMKKNYGSNSRENGEDILDEIADDLSSLKHNNNSGFEVQFEKPLCHPTYPTFSDPERDNRVKINQERKKIDDFYRNLYTDNGKVRPEDVDDLNGYSYFSFCGGR